MRSVQLVTDAAIPLSSDSMTQLGEVHGEKYHRNQRDLFEKARKIGRKRQVSDSEMAAKTPQVRTKHPRETAQSQQSNMAVRAEAEQHLNELTKRVVKKKKVPMI